MNQSFHRRRRARLALSWLFGASALIAACGGGSGGDDASAAAPSPGAPSPAPGPAPAPSPAASAPIAVTPAGDPEGLPAFATIGAAGGTLTSSDERLTVTIPAGALAADTEVGIQPITPTAPGALGMAYRLTPEGTKFAQPVTLTFKASASEAAATLGSSWRVATHDAASGHWLADAGVQDAAQRTLSVTTTHFSDWSYLAGMQLQPAEATVEVNQQQKLHAIYCGERAADENAQRVLLECEDADPLGALKWSVNGVIGGNTNVGTVEGTKSGTYTAPATVPAGNPVAVSVAWGAQTTLVSNIKVVDKVPAYTGTIHSYLAFDIDGKTATYETDANVRFVYNPGLSTPWNLWFDGSGTAFVRAKPFNCTSGSGTAAIEGASLQIDVAAGTYSFGGGADATATLTCGNPPREMTGPYLQGRFSAGGDGNGCPALRFGDNRGQLKDVWRCNLPESGATWRTNWTLRAND
ncbi:MAG: hypothetical protein U1E89_02270 [Burkholderiaceae bacterium]